MAFKHLTIAERLQQEDLAEINRLTLAHYSRFAAFLRTEAKKGIDGVEFKEMVEMMREVRDMVVEQNEKLADLQISAKRLISEY